jgi:hypothetical protein
MSVTFPKTNDEKRFWLADRIRETTRLLAISQDPATQARWTNALLVWTERLKRFEATGEFDTSPVKRKR